MCTVTMKKVNLEIKVMSKTATSGLEILFQIYFEAVKSNQLPFLTTLLTVEHCLNLLYRTFQLFQVKCLAKNHPLFLFEISQKLANFGLLSLIARDRRLVLLLYLVVSMVIITVLDEVQFPWRLGVSVSDYHRQPNFA